jgi:hypothetical protein
MKHFQTFFWESDVANTVQHFIHDFFRPGLAVLFLADVETRELARRFPGTFWAL